MIRAAAKNHADVTVVVEPADYAQVLAELAQHGGMTTLELRQKLAAKAYARTAAYDAAISNWFAETLQRRRAGLSRLRRQADRGAALRREPAPERRVLPRARRALRRRHARARCRASSSPTTTSTTPTRPMNASPSSIPSAPRPASSSSTPIRAAWRKATSLLDAYRKALACDPTSAFGGIVALNRTLDAEAAQSHHRDLHRGDHRAGRQRRGDQDRGGEKEPAAAAGRRPARSARAPA